MSGFLGCFCSLLWFVVAIGVYGYYSLAVMTIAKKQNFPNPWYAFVPILNFWVMVQLTKKEMLWFILCLIPIVNIYALIMIWIDLAALMNRPKNWGILAIVVVGAGLVAWGTWKPDFSVLKSGTTPPPAK